MTPRISPFLSASVALHAAAVPALALAPERWPWIVGTLVVDHQVAIVSGLLPRCSLLGPNVTTSQTAREAHAVVLTFDDGPSPDATPKILDLLDARGARATFFCIGERAARHRELAAEIARRGHRLENHSQTHRSSFFFHSPGKLRDEITRCQDELQRASGRAPSFFRPPAGIRSPLLQPALAKSGLRLASWTRRAFDTVSHDPATVASRLLHGLAAGDVLVLHDGGPSAGAAREPVAVRALPRILDAIEAAGLGIMPLRDAAAVA